MLDQDVLSLIWMPDQKIKSKMKWEKYENLFHIRWRWGGIVCSHHRPHGKHWIFIFFIEFAYLGYQLPFHWIFNSIQYVSHRFPDFFDILQVDKVSTRFFFVQVSYPKSISKEAKDICKGVSISVVNVIISISINIVLTVTPSDKDSIRGKKDTKL